MPEAPEPVVLGDLLELVAYDLQSPIAALANNLAFLWATVAAADQDARDALTDSLASCDGLRHIVENLAVLARSLNGAVLVEKTVLDVAALAADVVASCRTMAESHEVVIELASPAGPVLVESSSRVAVERSLANLLRNAIQHSPAQAVVRVVVRGSPSAAVLIEDAGAPIQGSARTTLFLASGQLEGKMGPRGRYGRGLGLYCASLAASAGHAAVRAVDPPSGTGNAFEMLF